MQKRWQNWLAGECFDNFSIIIIANTANRVKDRLMGTHHWNETVYSDVFDVSGLFCCFLLYLLYMMGQI